MASTSTSPGGIRNDISRNSNGCFSWFDIHNNPYIGSQAHGVRALGMGPTIRRWPEVMLQLLADVYPKPKYIGMPPEMVAYGKEPLPHSRTTQKLNHNP